jgi:hypothetical protein
MVPGALLAGHLLIEVTPQTRKAKSMIFLVTQQKESLTVEQVPKELIFYPLYTDTYDFLARSWRVNETSPRLNDGKTAVVLLGWIRSATCAT